MNAHAITIPDGSLGFDVNQHITADAAKQARAHDIKFVLRYIRRSQTNAYDLTPEEAQIILASGIGLMIVQHVKSAENWVPSGSLGANYGSVAAAEARRVRIGVGVCVWCDLEGVESGVPHLNIVEYAKNWYAQVAAAGFIPGLYIGWHNDLTANELYRSLPFQHYWAAYNLNRDQYPAVRGVQMQQGTQRVIAGMTVDPDVAYADALGGRAVMYSTGDA